MRQWLVAVLIGGCVLLTTATPTNRETESVSNHRYKRSFKELPTGLLEPILPLVKAIIPESLLGKITMLLPLPATSDSAMEGSN